MTGNSFERNLEDGIQLILPYLYSYDENVTHVVIIDNNTLVHNSNLKINIGGHFAMLNITRNTIQNNFCKGNDIFIEWYYILLVNYTFFNCIDGLITISGMEKYMLIWKNLISSNTGEFMIKFNIKSQCEVMSSVFALLRENMFKSNSRLLTPGVSIFFTEYFNFYNFKLIICFSQSQH